MKGKKVHPKEREEWKKGEEEDGERNTGRGLCADSEAKNKTLNAGKCGRSGAESKGWRVKECSQVKVIRRLKRDVQGGLSLSLALSPPLSPRARREADTSLHPFDRSQKGG